LRVGTSESLTPGFFEFAVPRLASAGADFCGDVISATIPGPVLVCCLSTCPANPFPANPRRDFTWPGAGIIWTSLGELTDPEVNGFASSLSVAFPCMDSGAES
jgi:hypothetical protein